MKAVLAVLIAALAVFSTAVTTQSNPENAVAATVNGTPIKEITVTSYIEAQRKAYGLTDDQSWGQYLAMSGATVSDLRSQIIDYFGKQQVVNDRARELHLSVSGDEVDEQINQIRENYGLTDDANWQQALDQMGFTEQAYRDEVVNFGILERKLFEQDVHSQQR